MIMWLWLMRLRGLEYHGFDWIFGYPVFVFVHVNIISQFQKAVYASNLETSKRN